MIYSPVPSPVIFRLALQGQILSSALAHLCLLITVIIPHYGSFAKLQSIFPALIDTVSFSATPSAFFIHHVCAS